MSQIDWSKAQNSAASQRIAAEQREKSIAEMCEVTEDKITIRSAGALYDAGYRKFEIVENEE